MKLIKLTHANLNQTIYVSAELVAGFYHSPGNACTHVVASGGAIFPARESVDDVRRLLTGQEAQKEKSDGNENQNRE